MSELFSLRTSAVSSAGSAGASSEEDLGWRSTSSSGGPRKIFTLFMRISERVKARITCPGCGSGDVEALMQPFVARTAKKS